MSELREALKTLQSIKVDCACIVKDMEIEDIKWFVLLTELDVDSEESTYDDCVFESGTSAYLILTEGERNERWEESLDAYLNEGGVEGSNSPYFDREAWKRDARFDGAGCALSSYDEEEHECVIGGEWYYIYRIN